MKKDSLRSLIVGAIILAIYNMVVFMVPFERNDLFWISYGFTLGAFVVAALAIHIAFIKKPDARSRFYGFPIAMIGGSYFVIQLAASLVVMLVLNWVPQWIMILIYSIGLAAALLGLIAVEAVVEEVHIQDQAQRNNITLMRSLQSKAIQMVAQCEDADAAKAVKDFAEELRFSDPVSSDSLTDVEADLVAVVDDLQGAVVDGDSQVICQLCRKATFLLTERNRLCKLHK